MMVRELTGMTYKSVELDHPVRLTMDEVLRTLADWISDNVDGGVLTSVTTGIHPEYEDRFLTHLVWSE